MKSINRRSFLQKSSLATAALAFPHLISCKPRKSKIGVALLGLGTYSRGLLAPALQETKHCYLAGIITGTPSKIPGWQSRYSIPDKNVYTYDTMHEIANNPDIDVIYIVTPTGTHAKFVIDAANTGKHVWCEKPMAMTVDECQSMIDICAKNKVKLTIGYRVQHEPNTLTVNSYASSKPFGNILEVDAAAGYSGGGPSGWRAQRDMGGGALYDMGVYTVNGMRNALAMEPIEVISARQYTDRPHYFKEVDETTEYLLSFPDNITGKGQTSVGKGYNYLKVSCENGSYEMRPMQTYGRLQGSRSDGKRLDVYRGNQQATQMDEDAMALLENRDFIISPTEGLKDIRIIEAIIKASETGGSVRI